MLNLNLHSANPTFSVWPFGRAHKYEEIWKKQLGGYRVAQASSFIGPEIKFLGNGSSCYLNLCTAFRNHCRSEVFRKKTKQHKTKQTKQITLTHTLWQSYRTYFLHFTRSNVCHPLCHPSNKNFGISHCSPYTVPRPWLNRLLLCFQTGSLRMKTSVGELKFFSGIVSNDTHMTGNTSPFSGKEGASFYKDFIRISPAQHTHTFTQTRVVSLVLPKLKTCTYIYISIKRKREKRMRETSCI